MNPRTLPFEEQQMKAIVLPGELIQAMDNRDGQGSAGLILTAESRSTIRNYSERMRVLPSTLAQTIAWLGYDRITEPELAPERMLGLFKHLALHARTWSILDTQCLAVTTALAEHARQVEALGAQVLDLAARTRAMGIDRASWATLLSAPEMDLGPRDLQLLRSMADQLMWLHGQIDDFDQQVDGVRLGLENFRDQARFTLRPAVFEKCRAAKRFSLAPDAEDLEWELSRLDGEILDVRHDYRSFSKQSTLGWLGGPFGAIISNSIYGAKARKARAQLHELELRHRQLSQRLAEIQRVSGRVNELNACMGELEIDLWDVVLASGHLHTTWQTIEAYLESSVVRLGRMNTRQELVVFILHFRQFLAQWSGIGRHAGQMRNIFA
ncbi:hypothetical protein C4Q28_21585 [Pseudomonas sp. SWI6]|uniref:Alpha-xenorhabdolysin family binary toxin subunit A n=2 Tax=Pseudomonas TaxID=286 RepID=A0ABR6V8J6_9PSED|nr:MULTISPECIES: alpha-xenorhabdolysin family binary toxin subunit A [Pseudomonas]AVD84572.1 hypothetical protein C4Q28_21585 [Pseudomonas sp. SWI6]MBC3476807.1 alpha-xenorhabdolysin family binary toxin subunit A [Pseudomonas taiwanensis]MBC3490865.1 alpha-xenorhabdolysin family binary toxin subunit A [Pseudomonas taiwanensis]MDT8925638.1 alpha-xenorhabdolysin family binary toxin subunit A [Pseudomonas taiwanensis]QQZ37337.1 alpha-xenorhabdolysin family binary toxin subunit A [Pseudomonas sp. 